MRVLLADDEPTVRSALRLLLEQEPDLEVVGEVGEASALAAWLQSADADLLIFDWELPGLHTNGHGDCLPTRTNGLKLVAISGRAGTRSEALGAGVDGFISKTDPPEQVLAMVRALFPCPPYP